MNRLLYCGLLTFGLLFGGVAEAKRRTAESSASRKKSGKKVKKGGRSKVATPVEEPVLSEPTPPTPAPTKIETAGPGGAPASSAPAAGTATGPAAASPAPAADAPGPKPKEAKPAPVMTFEAVDVSGKSSNRQKLDAASQQFKSGDYESAALAAYELMTDPKYVELALEGQYLLAKSLYRMGMYHSSLGEFSKVLAKGPQTKLFKPSLEWLFFISHKTTNESVILDEIAKYSNTEFPEKFRNEFRYLLARYYFVRGRALDQVDQKGEGNKSFDEVKKLALTLPHSDPFYPRAKYLEALALFRESKMEAAVAALREVVRLTRPGTYPEDLTKPYQDLRDLAFMQLARTHYGARQNRAAIIYYKKIERGRFQWLDALFEAAWAHYRIGQYEQALGNLITLSSPYFKDEYFPEALILKAVIYYENCRYREAVSILREFERIYLPVQQQLDLLVKKDMDASEYYNVLADVQKKNRSGVELSNTDLILERVLKLALTDKDLSSANSSILELEREMDNLTSRGDTFRYSNLTKSLLESLKSQRESLIKKAGIMAKGKLSYELDELTRLLGNGERIKFETTTKEKEFLEEQLQEGGRTAVVKKYSYSVAVADDELYWPFEGEYWRDELGTYQYTLTKGCVERDTANRRREGETPF